MSAATGPSAGLARGGAYERLAETALVAVTVVTAVGMSRLFTDTSFLRDVLAFALASHVVAGAARRVGLSTLPAALLSAFSFVVTATILRYSETAWFVLPTADTVSAARDHLANGWTVMNATPAPVVPDPGLVLSAGALLGVSAFLADTAAFRMRAAVSAVAPTAAIYGFTIAAGTGEGAIRHGALYCGAVGASMVAMWLRNRRAESWIEPGPGRGVLALARAGGAALVLAVAVGAVAGPWLPGARAEPWVDLARFEVTEAAPWIDRPNPEPEPWADFRSPPGGGAATDDGDSAALAGGPRVLVSPLVQVRSRLIEQSDRELFTVEVRQDEREYWRLTSLNEFDGNGWRARSQYEEAVSAFPATLDPSTVGPPLPQTVSLTGLGNSYLPVAYEARRVIDNGGVAMEYEIASGSLIKTRQAALAGPDRFTYAVESAVPRIDDPDRLRSVDTSVLEPDFLALNTGLPDEVRDLVLAEAERITSDARSDYHAALLLQDYFRLDGGFRYDLQVHTGSGIDSLEEFLFDQRAGYCQQFASAYAAMARSVGLPTRVAVGFTWGEWDAARGTDGAYVVRGKNAHAWPEVYFAGTGWVRFEPTPGRGAPGDFAVTGHVANQAGAEPEPAVSLGEEGLAPLQEFGEDRPDASGSGGLAFRGSDPGSDSAGEPGRASDSGSADGWNLWEPSAVAVLVVAALGLAFGSVPALRRLRRHRSRTRLANDPAGLVDLCWSEALEALALVRHTPRPCETPLELARRVIAVCPAVGPIEELAALATHGRYAPETPGSMADRAAIVGARVTDACLRQVSVFRRLAATVDPSTVFKQRRPL